MPSAWLGGGALWRLREGQNDVTDRLTRLPMGHFALVVGESKEGMRPIATHVRQVANQAFFAKMVKNEMIYLFQL